MVLATGLAVFFMLFPPSRDLEYGVVKVAKVWQKDIFD